MWVCSEQWVIDRGPHNTLLSVPCPAAGQLGLWLWQNERERSTQGPLNHRLGAGNSHFHHILLARASPKANPDSKGRKTNPTSSMEKLQGHIFKKVKTQREMKHRVILQSGSHTDMNL